MATARQRDLCLGSLGVCLERTRQCDDTNDTTAVNTGSGPVPRKDQREDSRVFAHHSSETPTGVGGAAVEAVDEELRPMQPAGGVLVNISTPATHSAPLTRWALGHRGGQHPGVLRERRVL